MVVVHKFPKIEDVHVGIKIVNPFPFQGRQPLEGRAPIAVLADALYSALEDEGGQAENLPVEVEPQAQGIVLGGLK